MIRVVSGTARGIQLDRVPGDTTRPILDRAKTALFDVLRPMLPGRRVLDLFAGTGSIGIEALSQGAEFCLFLDSAPQAVETIKSNLTRTKLAPRALVRHLDAFSYIKKCREHFDLIFVAPPQYQSLWSEAVFELSSYPNILSPNAVVVVQIDPVEYERLALEYLQEYDLRNYGNTRFILYRRKEAATK